MVVLNNSINSLFSLIAYPSVNIIVLMFIPINNACFFTNKNCKCRGNET